MKQGLLILACLTVITGCVQNPAKEQLTDYDNIGTIVLDDNAQPVSADIYQTPVVVRYDRYLLVNTSPLPAQKKPLEQVIDIKIPTALTPTVGDAMRYILRYSGYSLCTSPQIEPVLLNKPLPAIHYQLSPMMLKNALQVLAGEAWQLQVDSVQREVCYSLRKGYAMPELTRQVGAEVAK